MPAQTVILRPNPFGGFSSALIVLLAVLAMLGVVAHAAVL
jgi:hypothetical protein